MPGLELSNTSIFSSDKSLVYVTTGSTEMRKTRRSSGLFPIVLKQKGKKLKNKNPIRTEAALCRL
jgi:hypothetical protein